MKNSNSLFKSSLAVFICLYFTAYAYSGTCIEGNCTNGQGTYTFANGGKYVGKFKDGKYNGQGTFTFANGEKYVGEFKNNIRNGQGTFTFANGSKYVGEYKDGKPEGQGIHTWGEGKWKGDRYVGEWKDASKHGQGTYTFANGDKYVGEYKDDQYNGQGTFTFANGRVQRGIWENGKFVNALDKLDTRDIASAKTAEEWFKKAIVAYKSKDYDEIIRCLKKAIILKPNYVDAHLMLGGAYSFKRMFNESATEFKWIIKTIDSNHKMLDEAYAGLGEVYFELQQYQDAVNAIRQAIKLNPNVSLYYYQLGYYYELTSDGHQKAIGAYKQAIQIDPNNADAYSRLAFASCQRKVTDPIEKKQLELQGMSDWVCDEIRTPIVADYFYQAGLLHIKQGNRDYALSMHGLLEQSGYNQLAQSLYKKIYPELR